MIAIINSGEQRADGQHLYRLQINDKLIGEFWHHRADGLAACLRLAAVTADVAHDDKVVRVMRLAQISMADWDLSNIDPQ